MPSLQPDSADNRSLKCLGIRFANLPFPTTDEARTGSVAVTHAAQAKLSSHVKGLIIHQMNKLVTSHPKVMTGTSRKLTDFQCLSMYAFGNSTPTAKHCTTSTIREHSTVILSTFPQDPGSKRFAACGPKITPHMVATVASPIYKRSFTNREHSMNKLVKPPMIR